MQCQNVPQWILLKTRILRCVFEIDTGYLRPVKVGGVEVLRAVYGAVRDKNWNTVIPVVKLERTEQHEDDFLVEFTARCELSPIAFSWKGIVRAQGGELEFRFEGQAHLAFLRNRIGLCILHPIKECAGKPCRIQQAAGMWVDSEFPLYISPHQPFKDLRSLSWSPATGLSAEMLFEGEVFETEDQRNWTDASFKTYSTPLELPFPVEVARGEQIRQRVALFVTTGHGYAPATPGASPLTLALASGPAKRRPKIGLGLATHGQPLSEVERLWLTRLRLNHLRVDLHFRQIDWKETLKRAYAESSAIGSRLQCALFLYDSAEQSLLNFSQTIDSEAVDLCLIFHEEERSTSSRSFEIAKRYLGPRGFPLATGTNAYFAELNGQRPPLGAAVCYSVSPQVHAFDDLSLMETLEAQPATVESAAQFCDDGIVISPITLRPRFNPNATSPADRQEGELPSTVDPRQRTMFAAAWMVGTLSRLLTLERVQSLTFFETTGWQGVLERNAGSPDCLKFGSMPGEVFPVWYVFEALAGAETLHPVNVSDPQRIAGLAFSKDKESLICLLANLTRDNQKVEVADFPSGVSIATSMKRTLLSLVRAEPQCGNPFQSILGRCPLHWVQNAIVKIESKQRRA